MSRSVFVLAIVAALALTVFATRFFITLPHPTIPVVVDTTRVSPEDVSPQELTPVAMPTTTASVAAAARVNETEGPSVADFETAATTLRSALVNIICITPRESPFHSISASGVLVAPAGYILTSAHVAAYFLLEDEDIACVVRTGNPARAAYTAKLVYIPARWVKENAGVLVDPAPFGTGEHDFALLVVTGGATAAGLPAHFSHIPLSSESSQVGTPVVIGTYGAQTLSFAQIESALAPTIVASSVKSLFTFGTNTVDVLDFGGSAAAQEGSSGGGALSFDGTLIGSITTSTMTGSLASRSLSAVSAIYIRHAYEAETGSPLEALFSLPPAKAVADFTPRIPALEAAILAASGI